MKILHVNKYAYRRGGAESYAIDVAELQRGRGHEVELFGMEHPENPPLRYENSFAPLIELDPPPPGIAGQITTAVKMVHNRSAATALAAVLDDFKPDVVHHHNIYHQLSPSILRPIKERGITNVMTLHDYKLACPNYRMLDGEEPCRACIDGSRLSPIKKRCNRGSLSASVVVAVESMIHHRTNAYGPVDAFICPSHFMADVMSDAGIDADRLHRIPHFSLASEIDQDAELDQPKTGVVFAGRLSSEKGVATLIEAAHLMPDVRFTIAGDGPDKAELEKQAAAGPGDVVFTGRLSRQELQEVQIASAVTAVPSRWFENQPMIVLESYSVGTPVVASDMGGLSELIDDGVDGALVPHSDPKALAAALARYTSDSDLAATEGRRGAKRIAADHDVDGHLDELERLYHSLRERAEGVKQ